jgi:NAD(P)-dependent dehydrogenase (short-subunit alcohol dehydrogenase family)
MDFKGKVVFITGATGGIGGASAALFARQGAKLALVTSRQSNLEKLNCLAESLGLPEEDYINMAVDVRQEEEVKAGTQETVSRFGRIDIFVNNAGTEGKVAPIPSIRQEDLQWVLDVNIKGVLFGLKYVIPVMESQKSGSIINVSSVAGFIGSPGMAPYIASKHAVNGITKTAALECADMGIRINAVCPGPVNNRMMRSIEAGASPEHPETVQSAFTEAIPLKRYAESEEVANLILFLASDHAKYLTGNMYRIDGGMAAK